MINKDSSDLTSLHLSRLELESVVGDSSSGFVGVASGIGLLNDYPLVGGGEVTNSFCGGFSKYRICDRVAEHESIGLLMGKDFKGKVLHS